MQPQQADILSGAAADPMPTSAVNTLLHQPVHNPLQKVNRQDHQVFCADVALGDSSCDRVDCNILEGPHSALL